MIRSHRPRYRNPFQENRRLFRFNAQVAEKAVPQKEAKDTKPQAGRGGDTTDTTDTKKSDVVNLGDRCESSPKGGAK